LILVDAGPLVALIRASDRHHKRCLGTVEQIREPLSTTWPVVTEAMFLLRSWRGQDALWEMIDSRHIALIPLGAEDASRMRDLMRKYKDLPMDLADAALVCAAEKSRVTKIFTLDRKDFSVYRPHGGGSFSILP